MITGSIVAMITPFTADSREVDWPALKKLVEWHIEQGTSAIGAVGTTGESATLSMEENVEVIRFCVEAAKGRIPVIAGTGANSTSEAIELTRGARKFDADACLLVVPYYNKPTQEGMYRFRPAAGNRAASGGDSQHCRHQGGHRRHGAGQNPGRKLPAGFCRLLR